jgi:hypothetical protein
MARKEVEGPMKLTVPAIRPAEPNARRREVSEQTGTLLEAIDSLLAELATASAYDSKRSLAAASMGAHQLANRAGRGARPVPPAAA